MMFNVVTKSNVRRWCSWSFQDPTWEQLKLEFPPGWMILYDQLYATSELFGVSIGRIDTINLLLHVQFPPTQNVQHTQLLDDIATGIKRRSTQLCMKCGKKATRRKTDSGSFPPLCFSHFLNYMNDEPLL